MSCVKALLVFGLLFLLMYAFRRPLMRAAGAYLIEEEPPSACEAIFVLSGSAVDRAAEAYRMYHAGYAPYIVCTGENVPSLLAVLDTNISEAELSRHALQKLGMPDSLIRVLKTGTSTREEADLILHYSSELGMKKIMVVTDKFHTHRVEQVFRDQLKDAGIELVLRGAPSSRYDENQWWAGEAGLLMVNNEYIKLIYYFLSGLNR